MSSTRVQNIGPSITDNLPINFITNGTVKCYTAINGTGTIAIRDSFNTTSITDNAVGKYQTNITSPMRNVAYFASSTGCYSVVNTTELHIYGTTLFTGGAIDNTRTTSVCKYGAYEAAYVDVLESGVVIQGDLA